MTRPAAIRALARFATASLAALLGALLGAPLAVLLLLALAADWRYPALWPRAFDLAPWHRLAADAGDFAGATLRSAAIGTAVALIATAAGLATSERIARHRRRGALLALAVLPFAVSPVVLALSLQDGFLRLGLAGTVAGVAAAQALFAYAYATLLLNGLWSPHLRALTELAIALGASRGQLWRRLWLPSAAPLIGLCLFQTFLLSWCDFALARLVGGGQVATLPVRVFEYFAAGDLRLAAVCGLILVLPPLLALGARHRGSGWWSISAPAAPAAPATGRAPR